MVRKTLLLNDVSDIVLLGSFTTHPNLDDLGISYYDFQQRRSVQYLVVLIKHLMKSGHMVTPGKMFSDHKPRPITTMPRY